MKNDETEFVSKVRTDTGMQKRLQQIALLTSCLSLLALQVRAGMFYSTYEQGVCVGLCGYSEIRANDPTWTTNRAPIRFDDELAIRFLGQTSRMNIYTPLDKTLFIAFELRDSYGKMVAKTDVGALWGSDTEHFPLHPGQGPRNRMAWLQALGPKESSNPASGFGPILGVSAKDLFKIVQPGVYDMRVEVNIMKEVSLPMDPRGSTSVHVALPPLVVKIERPLDGQGMANGTHMISLSAIPVLSEPSENVYIGLCGVSEITSNAALRGTVCPPIGYKDRVSMLLCCTKATELLRFSDQFNDCFRLQLRDPSGNLVLKTELGEMYGANFGVGGLAKSDANVAPRNAYTAVNPNAGAVETFSQGPVLPAPNELFDIRASGLYEMTVELSFYKGVATGTNNYVWHRIWIPAISVKVSMP